VLPVISPAAEEPPPSSVSAEIPRPQFARIRTLSKYGMTVRQIAETYGVPDSAIQLVLRKA
jgi:hypothetical protein